MKIPTFEEVRVIDISAAGYKIFELMASTRNPPGFVSSTRVVFYTEDATLYAKADELYHSETQFKELMLENPACVMDLAEATSNYGTMTTRQRLVLTNLSKPHETSQYQGQLPLGTVHILSQGQLYVYPDNPFGESSRSTDETSRLILQLKLHDLLERTGVIPANGVQLSKQATANLLKNLTLAVTAEQLWNAPLKKIIPGLEQLKNLSYSSLALSVISSPALSLRLSLDSLALELTSEDGISFTILDCASGQTQTETSPKATLIAIDNHLRHTWQLKTLGHFFK